METTSRYEVRDAPRGLGGLLRNIGPGVVVSGSVVADSEPLGWSSESLIGILELGLSAKTAHPWVA